MKPLFFISCPINTYSGYGARSRDLVKAIIETDKYDVKVIPQMWGNTPWGFIEDNPEWEFLTPHLWAQPQLPKQPEVFQTINRLARLYLESYPEDCEGLERFLRWAHVQYGYQYG